jgi:hypothetical protein
MNKVEVLYDDWRSGARKVEREGVLNRTEIMEFKNEIFGKMGLVAPEDPTNTNISQSKLVTGSVDRDNPWEFEIPEEFWCSERGDKCTRGSIN